MEIRTEIGHQGASRRQRGTNCRNHEPPAPESARDLYRVEARGTATSNQHGAARVDALIDGDLDDGLRHVLCSHSKNGSSTAGHIETERSADLRFDGRLRRRPIELHLASQKELRIEMAER